MPIYQTSTFRFDSSEDYAETISFRKDGYTYSRGYGNPTVAAFESQMAALEGTEAAFGFASGMAAIHTVFAAHVRAGDRIVVSQRARTAAPTPSPPRCSLAWASPSTWSIRTTSMRCAPRLRGAALFHVETIANPNVSVADLAGARRPVP